ncbi:transcriptional regulator [Actinomadura craniellae]|uniref:Transcriptional regulator n=1 Tax=Actinomadura craniellae TaxID=2231787 RepID=A0A365HBC8_9ACTN|nr:metalloregulator ArsR/SmtB family transcription factor [Actinomadura craniellae]RAY15573.1 transcriptional regulator [Actinomadura craniellae]
MTLYHPPREQIELADVLNALGHPIRLKIVRSLAEQGECACSAISLDISKSTATHHWRVLRESGVIRQQQSGRTIMTSLRREDLDARFPGLLGVVLGGRSPELAAAAGHPGGDTA